jgi:hypothetical protein
MASVTGMIERTMGPGMNGCAAPQLAKLVVISRQTKP